MNVLDIVSVCVLAIAVFFFTAGTVGLVRLPDIHSRLHALTKADNLGLGLVILAVFLQAASWTTGLKLLLVWLCVLAAGTNVCFLVASATQKPASGDPGHKENR